MRPTIVAAALLVTAATAQPTHISPTRVGPGGGGVLLLHGRGLPYREALLGDATVFIGNRECPVLASRSDPKGSFLACGPIPPIANLTTSEASRTVHLGVYKRGISCEECTLTYAAALRADASLRLSHARGAAGDVVTIVGDGAWPLLLDDSHGHHERVTATIGGKDALPRHPDSAAVHRVGDYWNVELSLIHI